MSPVSLFRTIAECLDDRYEVQDEGCLYLLGFQGFQRNDFDNDETSIIDNPLPATTNINSIKRQLLGYKDTDGLVVVFSTYQSIDVLAEAQRALLEADPSYGIFDYIVCDEAHRTTGFKQKVVMRVILLKYITMT